MHGDGFSATVLQMTVVSMLMSDLAIIVLVVATVAVVLGGKGNLGSWGVMLFIWIVLGSVLERRWDV